MLTNTHRPIAPLLLLAALPALADIRVASRSEIPSSAAETPASTAGNRAPAAKSVVSAAENRAPAAESAASAAARRAPAAPSTAETGAAWLPDGAQIVLRIAYSDLKSSELFRSLAARRSIFVDETERVDLLVRRAGIDLQRDVDLGWIGTDGRAGGDSVAILAGRFDPALLTARVAKSSGGGVRPGADTVLTLASTGGDSAPTAAAFPRRDIAIVGSPAWVRLALDRMTGRGPSALDSPALGPLLRHPSTTTIWSAAMGPALMKRVGQEIPESEIAEAGGAAIETVAARFSIADDVAIDAEAVSPTEEDASLLSATLKGLAAFAAMQASSDRDLHQALQSVVVERHGSRVHFQARVPASLARRIQAARSAPELIPAPAPLDSARATR